MTCLILRQNGDDCGPQACSVARRCIFRDTLDHSSGTLRPVPFRSRTDIDCSYEMRSTLLSAASRLCRRGFERWSRNPKAFAHGYAEKGAVSSMQSGEFDKSIEAAMTETRRIHEANCRVCFRGSLR